MVTIQLALSNTALADALRGVLARSTDVPVRCVDCPDPLDSGVIVVDPGHLRCLSVPLPHPERVVLIASEDPGELDSAWNAGVNSVIYERDPLNTAVLAILSACLRAGQCRTKGPPEKRASRTQ